MYRIYIFVFGGAGYELCPDNFVGVVETVVETPVAVVETPVIVVETAIAFVEIPLTVVERPVVVVQYFVGLAVLAVVVVDIDF